MKERLIGLIRRFPKGSIWQTRYLGLPTALVASTLVLSHGALPVGARIFWFVTGLAAWTLMEYVIHRWLFHFSARGEIGGAILERLHVAHHAAPNDRTQVCVPMVLCLPFWAVLLILFRLAGGGAEASVAATCGIALMMVIYDITHYSAHYMPATNGLLKFLKAYHLQHHATDERRLFGVTSPFWDWVFRTGRTAA